MYKLPLTFFDKDGSGNIIPHTGYVQKDIHFYLASDNVTEITYTDFQEIGNGNYDFWGFSQPARVRVKRQGNWDDSFAFIDVGDYYVDVVSNQFISGVKTFAGEIQRSSDIDSTTNVEYITKGHFDRNLPAPVSLTGLPGLSLNNIWTGFNTFNGNVTMTANLTNVAGNVYFNGINFYNSAYGNIIYATNPIRIEGNNALQFYVGGLSAQGEGYIYIPAIVVDSHLAQSNGYNTISLSGLVNVKPTPGLSTSNNIFNVSGGAKFNYNLEVDGNTTLNTFYNSTNGSYEGKALQIGSNNSHALRISSISSDEAGTLVDVLNVDASTINNGKVSITGTLTATNIQAKTISYDPTCTKFISGNLVPNDVAFAKWVSDNFQSIYGVQVNSQTFIVDQAQTIPIDGKVYPTYAQVLAYLGTLRHPPTPTNIYTILMKQAVSGYNENIDIYDWTNVIGEGLVNIQGQLLRTSTTGGISKISNLNLLVNDASHSVENVDSTNCIFETRDTGNGGGVINITNSKCKNIGFYGQYNSGAPIISSGNNKIIGCFGSSAVNWNTTLANLDKVYGYSFIQNDTYNF